MSRQGRFLSRRRIVGYRREPNEGEIARATRGPRVRRCASAPDAAMYPSSDSEIALAARLGRAQLP